MPQSRCLLKKQSSWHWILGRLAPECLQTMSISHPLSHPCCCRDELGGWKEPCLEEQKALRGRKERRMAGGGRGVTPNANRHLVLVEFPNQTRSAAVMCTRGETTTLQGHRAPPWAPRERREPSSLLSPLPQSQPTSIQ